MDLLQAYVQVSRATTSAAWAPDVQLGRFTMELGSGRLIAQEQYRDVTHLIAGHFLKVAPNATREGNTTFSCADVTYSLASRLPAFSDCPQGYRVIPGPERRMP